MERKKAELSQALQAAQQAAQPPNEVPPMDDLLTDKVAAMEHKAKALAQQLHAKVSKGFMHC